ncbi:hypothetical protein [Streptomyces violaceusniger]|uniref:Uncharacterized protein n=1 Tax=Streptomyces violaceusniger (strain Tu 4113) TaxID=653045 RepID=G2PHR7_STRV4|nr:hypothetical protein [Streptomyces violaceusniger]AEM88868.1 hypothetical protein Strvi_0092 [Streptomyces violaceusniger Tu 4113]
MSLSPETRDSVIVGVSMAVLFLVANYTISTLARCAEGVLLQRHREERERLAASESPAVEAEPEGTGDDPGEDPSSPSPGTATGTPLEGSENPRSTTPRKGSAGPPPAGE